MENDEILKLLRLLLTELEQLDYGLDLTIPQWKSRAVRVLQGKIVAHELELLRSISATTWANEKFYLQKFLASLIKGVETVPSEFVVQRVVTSSVPGATTTVALRQRLDLKKVFVVHGHDHSTKTAVCDALVKLGLVPIVLHEHPNQGRTIIEKFEDHSSDVAFAVVLLTPDDVGHPVDKEHEKRTRARQNVVLELGYFLSALGRQNVAVLHGGHVEIPSDYLGVLYIPLNADGAWAGQLRKEIENAGLQVDVNLLV